MPVLSRVDLDDVSALGDAIRAAGRQAATMEEAAAEVVRVIYDEFRDEEGNRACALVRLYKTHPFGRLPASLQAFALEAAGHALADDVRCLTLLATAGVLPAWNERRLSVGHQTIPLPSEQMVLRLPMVSRLITQLGLDVGVVVRPQGAPLRELSARAYDAFHVEKAEGSEFIPAQDFVREHGIASALGFGGMLHTGDFYAVVLFSKVPIPNAVADVLRILGLAVRVPLMRFLLRDVFAER